MTGYTAALICTIITFGMALLQLSLTLGAPFGEYVLGGAYKVLPPKMRWVSAAFSMAFVLIGLAYLERGSIVHVGFGPLFLHIIMVVNTIFLGLAVVGNGFLTKSRKERLVMTPLSVIQLMGSIFLLVIHK